MSEKTIAPAILQINGWSPDCGNRGRLEAEPALAVRDVGKVDGRRGIVMAPPVRADDRDWRHPEVGWGLVLHDDETVPDAVKARGEDAPEPLRRLLAARPGSPVLRWSALLGTRALRRYYADGTATEDLEIGAPTFGTAAHRLPRYLLVYGSPAAIPWAVQFALNMAFCVGRLDLGESEGLAHYIDALIGGWAGIDSNPRSPLVWGVDHGKDDITWLMARAIANRLARSYQNDADLSAHLHLKDEAASGQNLLTALVERKPALVVTTSHGATGPISDAPLLIAQLGLLVDVNHTPVPLAAFSEWQPSGAIWYAQACCSAGSDAYSRYTDLVGADSGVGQILEGVSKAAGARIAPLPRLLLGSRAPLRAFVGHVEPTFDWTLRQPDTGEVLTAAVTEALYNDLYQPGLPMPIGLALHRVFKEAGAYFAYWADAHTAVNENLPGAFESALYNQLVAMDRQSLVILGDPTVALPTHKH